MKFIFLMDPLETVNYEKDTTLALMLGAKERGHDVYYLPVGGINLKNGLVYFNAVKVTPRRVKSHPFITGPRSILPADKVDAVFVRTDPPFDQEYLMHTWLLDRLPSRVAVINSPRGIRTVNEKIWASQFTDLVPRTLISRDKNELWSFAIKENDIIAKPTDGHGGKGVFRIKPGDSNASVILETLSERFTREIILQKYVTSAARGDKRILLLNGEPLGAVLRVHAKGDHRNNFFSGGKASPAGISRRDKVVIETLRPHLLDLGLYFVGIDMLGDYLTEVNVTSPTCLQEINRFTGQKLEHKVIAFAESLARDRQSR